MGVYTDADEHKDKAEESIQIAIDHLSEIVVKRCWGHDDYKNEYRENLKEIFNQLLEIRDKF